MISSFCTQGFHLAQLSQADQIRISEPGAAAGRRRRVRPAGLNMIFIGGQ
ncbi:hypothetical protein [Arthrobacter koreensis]|nr:hypothetical protein [Arthrobacter koreensis]